MIVIRHPTPAAAPGLCYGRLDLAAGPGEAGEIEAALMLMPPVARVVSSPAGRCLGLAEAIGARFDVAVETDARLVELDFGAWEGRRWDGIDRAESDPWAEDPWAIAPPGGEPFAALHARVGEALGDLTGAAPVALVTHAGPIRAARMIVEGLDFRTVFAEPVPFARPIRLGRQAAVTG